MFRERVVLQPPLRREQSQELARRLFFVSEQIVDFTLIEQDNLVTAVEVASSQPLEAAALRQKINAIIASDIIDQRATPPKLQWRSRYERPPIEDMFEQMVAQGIADEVAEGQVCVGEPFISVMNYFDGRLRQIALDQLGGREYQYPTLIRTDVLDRCGYFSSFPQFLMFVTRLHSDIDTYRAFLEQYRQTGDVRTFALRQCQNLDYCLPPTMCFHTYHQLRDRQLGADQNLVVTSRGKSFRFESRYHHTLERLWDFTIREIVFVGARAFVLECRQRFMREVFRMIDDELGLMGFCEVANDPFFANRDTAEKIWSQKLLELKYELRLHVAAERTIAAGSFNFHEGFFGENFRIRHGERDWARTACVGFGLERLAYAFLCQYGLDQRAWPQLVREGVARQQMR